MSVSAEKPLFNGKAPHLMCTSEDIAEIVLLPGDPGRVKFFEELCTDFKIIASNREYTIGTGNYNGTPITVCSTGIGAPSTEIAVVELVELGAKALIRIGGTGVLRKEIKCGDMVITTGAVRRGGTSHFYAPLEYPAIASFEVVESLMQACKNADVDYWKGISASIGSFFAGQARPTAGVSYYPDDLIEQYKKLGVLSMEMESETILTLGSLFNVYTGCICATHANRETDEWLYDFAPAQKKMCEIALEACSILHKQYLKQD